MQEGRNVTLEQLERKEKDWHPRKERSRSFRAAAGRQDRKSIAPDLKNVVDIMFSQIRLKS